MVTKLKNQGRVARVARVAMKRWIRGGSLSADAFRMFVCGSVFFGGIIFVRDHGIETALYVARAPSRIMAGLESGRKDRHNLDIIEAAKREHRDKGIMACEITSNSRGQLIECIRKLDNQ